MSNDDKSGKPLRCCVLHKADFEGNPRPGIALETVGALQQHLTLFTLAPGQIDDPVHTHPTETGGYVLRGRVGFYFGDNLEIYDEAGPGDFLFTPANVPHLVVNASKTESALVVVARPESATEGTLVPVPDLEKARLEGRTAWKP